MGSITLNNSDICDENEYMSRAIFNGYKLYTITKAIHYHPQTKSIIRNVFPFCNKYQISIKPKERSKIFYRNLGYIYKTYHSNSYNSLKYRYIIYFLLHFQFCEAIKFSKAYKLVSKNLFDQ